MITDQIITVKPCWIICVVPPGALVMYIVNLVSPSCCLSQQELQTAMASTAANAGGRAWKEDPEAVQEATSQRVADAHRQMLAEKMASLFVICAAACDCPEESCALKAGRFWPQMEPADPCRRQPPCPVCKVFARHLDLCHILARSSTSKGALFSRLLASAVAVHQLYELAVPKSLPPGQKITRKQSVKALLCSLLEVERNRLQCIRRIGELALLVPQLLCVQLSSGRAAFWEQLRRVANTVIAQRGRPAKLLALEAIRKRLPDDSSWKDFLTPSLQT